MMPCRLVVTNILEEHNVKKLLYHAGGEIFWKAAIRKSGGDVTAALTL
jgi:hypothetical protein